MSINKTETTLTRIKPKYYWIIAGLITALLVYLGLYFSGMLFGGKYVIQRGDLLESHMAYIKMLCRHILNGESIWYSFDISMGMNTSLVLAYYAFSPFNFLFLLLFKFDNNFAITLVLIIKLALAASFFQLFANKVLKICNWYSIVFSVCYALCGFSIAYGSIHIMWLDGFLALPLLCLFISIAFEKNNYVALSLCYAYIFMSQFYIGYMVSVFSILYFIALLIFSKKNVKEILRIVFRFIIAIVLAIMISSIVWLPALIFLMNNYAPDSTSFNDTTGITIIEMINSLFWGQYTDGMGRYSYTYCGIPVFLVVPFYFFNNKISLKERILAGCIIVFLALGYLLPIMYKMLHAFDSPDFFSFRFSFLLSFAFCAIALRQTTFWKEIKIKELLIYVVGLLLIYAIEQRLEFLECVDNSAHNTNNFLINLAFIFAWSLFLFLFQHLSNKYYRILSIVVILLLGLEEVSNMNTYFVGKTNGEEYYNWEKYVNAGMESVRANENKNDFYRVIVDDDFSHNSDSLFGYNGVSDFGSAENYQLRKAMSNMGFGTSPRVTSASGYTPVTNMLLGIKYSIFKEGDSSVNPNGLMVNIVQNENSLNLGYMVEDAVINYDFPSRNVFENLNDILSKMTGMKSACFTEINSEDVVYNYQDAIMYQKEEAGEYYIRFDDVDGQIGIEIKNKDYDGVYVQFQSEHVGMASRDYRSYGYNVVNSLDYYFSTGKAVGMFLYPDTDIYYMFIKEVEENFEENSFDAINIYSFNKGELSRFYEDLSKEQLIVDEYEAGYVRGHISVNSDRRILFTSIPYDKAWSVKINGEDSTPLATAGEAFMALQLPDKGDYEIEMKYEAPGVKLGGCISLFGILFLASFFLFLLIRNKRLSTTVMEGIDNEHVG